MAAIVVVTVGLLVALGLVRPSLRKLGCLFDEIDQRCLSVLVHRSVRIDLRVTLTFVWPTRSLTILGLMPSSMASVVYVCHTSCSLIGGKPASRLNR